jgi:hypothetical protein
MWRTFLTAVLIYGCGHPGLERFRPALLGVPLQAFHQHVNAAALDGKKLIAGIDDSRFMRHLKEYIAGMDARLRSNTPTDTTTD